MPLPVAADLASILGDQGVRVWIHRTASPVLMVDAQVSPAAEEEQLEDDSPTRLAVQPVWILFAAGGLGDLVPGEKVNVDGGPLAGEYTVDRSMRIGDGSIGQVLAR